jgi:hypothetical protein
MTVVAEKQQLDQHVVSARRYGRHQTNQRRKNALHKRT